jgi:RND family efflux transporter MFP subunit
MKFFFGLMVILGMGAGGYFLWKKSPAQEAGNGLSNRPTTAVVEVKDIQFAVNAAGDIGPADQVSVRPEVNGRIAELPVDIGDKVAKDALLCRLDDKDLQIERTSRTAEIDGAKLSLQKASRNYGRSKQLFDQKLIAAEIYDDSKTEFELATNALERAVSGLRLVEDRISKTKILAPFDCTVLIRPCSLGQTVSGSAGFNSGTEIMTIANLNDMIVNAHINQADVTRLTPRQTVDIQVESVSELKLKGTLDRIAPQAVIKNGIKGFAARVLIKDIDPRIRPGMTAILTIPVASAENVLTVPLAAVFSESGDRYVFVKHEEGDEKFERRPIVIGVADYEYAEVREGLSAGEIVSLEQVVDSSMGKLRSGSNRYSGLGPGPTNATTGSNGGKSRKGEAGAERPSRKLGS